MATPPLAARPLDGWSSPRRLHRLLAAEQTGFLLESALPHERLGRVSLLAVHPKGALCAKGRRVSLFQEGRWHSEEADPFAVLRRLLQSLPPPPPGFELPVPCGLTGYFGYELGRQLERLPHTTFDDLELPELFLTWHRCGVVWDHPSERMFLVHEADAEGSRLAEELHQRIRGLSDRATAAESCGNTFQAPEGAEARFRSNFSQAGFMEAVLRAKEYIAAGDIYQVNLAQRFEGPAPRPAHQLYHRLCECSPAPFAAFLKFPGFCVLSSSPERFLRVEGRRVETCPIKGTRPRGRSEGEDRQLRQELVASEKDAAELAMIVDLERNDLGKVCRPGSVRVARDREIQSYRNVHHLISTVVGEMEAGVDAVELLRATFPGGSITGAPKVRAMELIDELEPHARGPYTGAIGYLDGRGNLDLSIAIRIAIVRSGRAYFHVGAGIVADSDPQAEYFETLAKSRGLMQALAETRSPGEGR